MAIIDVETQNQESSNYLKLRALLVAGAHNRRYLHLDCALL